MVDPRMVALSFFLIGCGIWTVLYHIIMKRKARPAEASSASGNRAELAFCDR